MKTNRYQSWGRYPTVTHRGVKQISQRNERLEEIAEGESQLAFGQGRSYGDVCLNAGGILLDTAALSRLISFDPETGLLSCEAGETIEQILKHIVPHGWFLPVTPGTKYVSLGGAIANDIHGKNHHKVGTIGRHVTRFELLRSDGTKLLCSRETNQDFFQATIGGLGLTGLITWAEIQLQKIRCNAIIADYIRFRSLAEFFALSDYSSDTHEFTVAWVDCLATGSSLGRGIFIRGNWDADGENRRAPGLKLALPFDFPTWALNRYAVQAFNSVYFSGRRSIVVNRRLHYEPFFYPLDSILNWNRMYGRRGFLQYQCVVPITNGSDWISDILVNITKSRTASFLAVLKVFGDMPSPGILSFPRPGVTLSLDFPVNQTTLLLLEELDTIVRNAGGAIYPAKDSRMSAENFKSFFPQWEDFTRFIDPSFSSSFWRRVTG